jgi:hypothetical protein
MRTATINGIQRDGYTIGEATVTSGWDYIECSVTRKNPDH